MKSNNQSVSILNIFIDALPLMIATTNIEKQIDIMENSLSGHFSIDSIGIILNSCSTAKNIVQKGCNDNEIEKIDTSIYEYFQKYNFLTNLPAFFISKNKNFNICNCKINNIPLECNGLSFALKKNESIFGIFFIISNDSFLTNYFLDENSTRYLASLLSSLFYNTWMHQQNLEKIKFLNLYETVSSSLCYAEDLQQLLTTIISLIVSEVDSEEGSILLYNEESDRLEFFSAMGDTGSQFIKYSFPANKGIAGKCFQNCTPLLNNDVQNCPYFFGNLDNESGFVTKSILAAPIIIGEEKIGVIEAINKANNRNFEEKDKKILIAIADEVGLAVKNARMFEYVVNSYCKIKQGESSCKGCARPLKSWTPCARQSGLI